MTDPGSEKRAGDDDFAEECVRQVARAAAADRADPELMNFIDAALDDLADLRDWT